MLIEAMVSAALGGALYGYVETKRKKKEKIKLDQDKREKLNNINTWKKCLKECDIKGIRNKSGETFELYGYKKTNYGFLAKTKAPTGVDWMALNEAINGLETKFKGMIGISKDKYNDEINVEVITRKPEFNFIPVKTKSCDEWFAGLKANGDPVFVGLNDNPHIIYTGKTGSGKTFVEFMSVTNLLYNYKNDFDMYIVQVVNGETKIFKDCKSVKMIADTFEEAVVVLEKLVDISEKRAKEIISKGYISVKHWNKDFPRKKYKRIFLLMDEFSFFKIEDGDDDEIKKLKGRCEKAFKRIAKAGRAMSISLVAVTQKMNSENINTTVRSQMAVISLAQHNSMDSKLAVGTSDAVRLDKREAIIRGQGVYEKVFIPTIKAEQPQLELSKFVPQIMIPKKINTKEDWDNRLTLEESNALRTFEERMVIQYSKNELEEQRKRKEKSKLVKEQNKDRETDNRKNRKLKKIKGA